MAKAKSSEDDLLKEGKEAFELSVDHESHNREEAMDDVRFARLDEQWPEPIRQQRELAGLPCLTINKLMPVIRQVVNDARQNKPAITIHPADDNADVITAEIMSGLIRNIEYASNADVAYDTALECAVTGGFGYFRLNTRYSHDDTFDQDIVIDAVPNPFSVYGDPHSTKADSADWNSAFVVDMISKKRFEAKYKGAAKSDWEEIDGYTSMGEPWREESQIRVAEWWKRDEVVAKILALSNGEIIKEADYVRLKAMFDADQVAVVGQPREVRSWKVTQYLMTGAEVLETTPWAGKYIPIVPVYGDEVNVGGERHFRSLVRSAKDANRMVNYWRSQATALVALAPKAPFIGSKGSFESDREKWETSNSESHAFIEYDAVAGGSPPQRQPFAGVPAGALQEAINASDDIKAITGIYDASLGAPGNETSGRAILLRQKEGDTSTFHYIDNLSRAIRHAGRILIDLIPHVYSSERVIRVTGPEGQSIGVPLNQQVTVTGADGVPMARIFDLTSGKYDLTVEAGPSFSTKREEAANQMLELIRAYPNAAMVLGDLLAKNLDWPGADQVAERLHALLPAALQGAPPSSGGQPALPGPGTPPSAPPGAAGLPPEAVAAAHQAAQQMSTLQQENQQLKLQLAAMNADKSIDADKADTSRYEAETKRMKTLHDITAPAHATTGSPPIGRTVGPPTPADLAPPSF